MDVFIIAVCALGASALTFFSGFGLGTLLMPAFALFVPVPAAVAATALVHGANNVLKAALMGRFARWWIVVTFGLPAVLAAFAGAALLGALAGLSPLATYSVASFPAVVTPLKLLMGFLMAGFALVELLPRFRRLEFDPRYLVPGGLLSGFFGGLSGHQGAFRSAFLAKAGLTPQAFVGTNCVIGLLVDAARLSVYGAVVFAGHAGILGAERERLLAGVGTAAAFSGVLVGRRLLHKVTMRGVQTLAGILLFVVAAGLASGLL